MNTKDLGELVKKLETLDSLGRLFAYSWFPHVIDNIEEEKVRAYLMVFGDAFPGINRVIEFVRNRAKALACGDVVQIQEGFDLLCRQLIQREIATDREVESGKICKHALAATTNMPAKEDQQAVLANGEKSDINALFDDRGTRYQETRASRDEIEALLASKNSASRARSIEAIRDESDLLDEKVDAEDDNELSREEDADVQEMDLDDFLDEEELEKGRNDFRIAETIDKVDDDSRESGIAQAISADELSFLLNDEIADVPKADNTHKAGTGRPKVSSKRHENAKSLDGMANGDNVFSQEDIDALFS